MAVPLKFDFEIFTAFFSGDYTGQVETEQHWSSDKGLRLFATRGDNLVVGGKHKLSLNIRAGEREAGFLEAAADLKTISLCILWEIF